MAIALDVVGSLWLPGLMPRAVPWTGAGPLSEEYCLAWEIAKSARW
jgi:hypothetical protein